MIFCDTSSCRTASTLENLHLLSDQREKPEPRRKPVRLRVRRMLPKAHAPSRVAVARPALGMGIRIVFLKQLAAQDLVLNSFSEPPSFVSRNMFGTALGRQIRGIAWKNPSHCTAIRPPDRSSTTFRLVFWRCPNAYKPLQHFPDSNGMARHPFPEHWPNGAPRTSSEFIKRGCCWYPPEPLPA